MFQEVTPPVAYKRLTENKDAMLIDCRTEREWEVIGVPDLSQIDKSLTKIELLRQDQSINPIFVEQIAELAQRDTPLYLICRSGARSASACQMLLKAGFIDVTNVSEGFEGHSQYQERTEIIEGWQSHNLPWKK
tara:strand:+ start:77 stop:478 length:402 start_codon:yes stop_codon:yes gene_type:complete